MAAQNQATAWQGALSRERDFFGRETALAPSPDHRNQRVKSWPRPPITSARRRGDRRSDRPRAGNVLQIPGEIERERITPRPLNAWVRYYREHAPEEPTAKEREMYRHYLRRITGITVNPRSLETWVADYHKHQMRPPTVAKRKMYAEYVELRGTSVLPRSFDDWLRDSDGTRLVKYFRKAGSKTSGEGL